MKNRKRMVSILAGIMAFVMLLTLILGLLPTPARAASSSEIRKQINQLKKEKEEIKDKIQELLNTPFDGKTEKQKYQRKGIEEGLKMALDAITNYKGKSYNDS